MRQVRDRRRGVVSADGDLTDMRIPETDGRHDEGTVEAGLQRQIMDEVAESLSNALENGHDFKGWSDEAIADDMYDCGGLDVDDAYPRELVIAAIRAQRT